ncbi:MAG: DNA polymerase III subunit delta [Chroococcidiopsidaceae cyanobacterium CP_BM_ER_R8_30]|nr:DNA polymerase III subunit delta [Chroococcidiopsidaceae cyanobacterium CP_BM_ER_R8_30]
MPIYLYWGEDDFAIQKAAASLRDRLLAPEWASFNYTSLPSEQPDALVSAMTLLMTPPFGAGHRLVWLVDTNLCQQCSEETLTELKRTLPEIPETSVFLLTSRNKPDGRLKSTQLLQKYAYIREFSLIPPWKTDQIVQQVQQAAQELGVKLTPESTQLLAEAVGNNTRLLYSELEKLRTFALGSNQPLDINIVAELVQVQTHNSLQLAAAITTGNAASALTKVAELVDRNEPALRIVATLIGQFRTWLWVKLMTETTKGDRSENAIKLIAQAAEISNPKRVYFLQQEVKPLALQHLISTLPLLLELEVGLKQGAEEISTLQTKVVELCQVFK